MRMKLGVLKVDPVLWDALACLEELYRRLPFEGGYGLADALRGATSMRENGASDMELAALVSRCICDVMETMIESDIDTFKRLDDIFVKLPRLGRCAPGSVDG